MIHQFTFENYKSFREETTLDFIASPITEHPNDIAVDCYDEKVLKVIAIFGANASGKSNVIKAFKYMRDQVLQSFYLTDESNELILKNILKLDPYRFDNSKRPSLFEVLFSINGDIFQYGFRLSEDVIEEEYLFIRDKSIKKEKYEPVFYRKQNEFVEISNDFNDLENMQKYLETQTLFLSFAANLRIPIAIKVYNWFKKSTIKDYGSDFSERQIMNTRLSPLVRLLQDKEQKASLETFVKAIDLGIEGFSLVENEFISSRGTEKEYQVITYHKNIDDNSLVAVPLSHESSGTKKMIALYIPISVALQQGTPLFIDELDAKLHPLLLRYLIILFHNKETNPNNAQLIFATHDVFTLDKSNFRRDEIWFVDKDEDGISDLYSLDSYILEENGEKKKVRKDASYGKDYILGKYKSIPKLKPIGE